MRANAQSAEPGSLAASVGGMLRGRVSNLATGEYLEGATVSVVGTSQVAYTSKEGTYVLSHLPLGPLSVRATYPGLDVGTADVDLARAPASVHDFRLTSGVYVLPELTIAGTREGNAAAIARQEREISVVNVVAADAFGSIANGNIGAFMQRLPGVAVTTSTVEIQNISLRGMSPDFTVLNMDGTPIASASEARAQVVGGIPADFIESVEIVKTPSADMSADSLGGTVNLKTRSAFDRAGRHISLSAAAAYNTTYGRKLDPTYGEYLFPSFKLQYSDTLSVLGGKQNLGVTFVANNEVYGLVRATVFAVFQPNWNYISPSRPLRVNYTSHQFHRQERAGANMRVDYKLSEGSRVSFTAGFTRLVENMERLQPTFMNNAVPNLTRSSEDVWVFDRARYGAVHDLVYRPTDTWRWSLQGAHDWTGSRVKVSWDLTYSTSERYDIRRGATVQTLDDIAFIWDRTNRDFPTLVQTGGRDYRTNTFNNAQLTPAAEHRRTTNEIPGARLTLERPFELLRIPTLLKTGFQIRHDRRMDHRERTNQGRAIGSNFSTYVDRNFTFDWVGSRYPHSNVIDTARFFRDAGYRYIPEGIGGRPGLKFSFHPDLVTLNADQTVVNGLRDSYWTRETIPAAFVQGVFRLTDTLRTTAGLRYERTDVAVKTPSDIASAATPEIRYGSYREFDSGYKNWFPNLQFRYEPWKRLLFRAAYSTTIGRPAIADLTTSFVQNDTNATVTFANPGLKPQRSQNYDLSAEYYFEPVGVVSVSVFRKSIKNYVTTTAFTISGKEFGLDLEEFAGWQGITKMNSGTARVDGVEFNYTQQFTFLPGVFKGFGVFFNWTALSTRGNYGALGNVKLPFKNALVDFNPQTGNAGLSYAYGRWDVRLDWNFADTYLDRLDLNDPSGSVFFGRRTQIDAFLKYKLSRKLQLFMDAVNLGPSHRTNYTGRATEDRRAQTHGWSTVVTAGVKASL
ncbi:MAG: TonB-dependent receptor [Opitutaceae bacterium]|nr:TonB-dependent receptor [Opitutaceae bacterium]